MSTCAKNPARRRYLVRFASTMSAYVILFAFAQTTFHHRPPTGLAAVALAISPALATLASIVVVGIYIAQEQDEFQRMLFVSSLLWGLGLTLAFTTARGFLELFTPMPKFPLYAVYPLFWTIVGFAGGAHSWYYRSRNE